MDMESKIAAGVRYSWYETPGRRCANNTEEEETLWRIFDEFVDPVRLRCLRVHISNMEIN